MTRLIGLDHGSRRIGVAIGDTDTGMAFARPALRRQNTAADIDAIAQMARDEEAATIVLGLPRNMDGSEGVQAAAARKFGERLAAIGPGHRLPGRAPHQLAGAGADGAPARA